MGCIARRHTRTTPLCTPPRSTGCATRSGFRGARGACARSCASAEGWRMAAFPDGSVVVLRAQALAATLRRPKRLRYCPRATCQIRSRVWRAFVMPEQPFPQRLARCHETSSPSRQGGRGAGQANAAMVTCARTTKSATNRHVHVRDFVWGATAWCPQGRPVVAALPRMLVAVKSTLLASGGRRSLPG